jgi:tryptophan halogenase
LELEDGRTVEADLWVDASGFRSELLGRTLEEPYESFARSLFCDRAVIAGWPREEEPIRPYTVAETMEAGWCWQIEHERWINRGYVYSSQFVTDEEALLEFRRKNPKLANEPRVVRFRSGRYARSWVENVVAVGNAAGFVEPLEATALAGICVQSRTLADTLLDTLGAPPPTARALYNELNGSSWDDTREFLAVHYAFNQRLETPFWQACRRETDLSGAERLLAFYRENGPSTLGSALLLRPNNQFGIEGHLALLCGQQVPHEKPYAAPPAEAGKWRARMEALGREGAAGCGIEECLGAVRAPDFPW